jgi:hypothetical protein
MPETSPQTGPSRPDTAARVVPREYAGKWVAWSADGRRIVAVGKTFAACEREAAAAGFGPGEVAIDHIPVHRRRLDGPGA